MKLLHLSFIIAMGLILIVPSSQAASDLERKLIDSIAIKEKEAISCVDIADRKWRSPNYQQANNDISKLSARVNELCGFIQK